MSYFDFFTNTLASDDFKDKDEIRGTCNSFCPKEEVEMREREKMVHVLEVLGDSRVLVKAYSRSAADSNMAKPHLLRPYPVLKDTVEHLLFDVIRRTDVPTAIMYDFINDRLRAVRQDMTIQRLNAELLEPMVRFYVWFGYKLSDAPISDFDPILNKKYILECLKWYLSSCNQSRLSLNYMGDMFANLHLSKAHEVTNDKVLMESLYILSNLDNEHPLFRFLGLDKKMRGHPLLQTSYEIAIANITGNFVRAARLSARLCPLTYCAFCLHLPFLQRRALQILSHGYNSARLSVPLRAVRGWLAYPCDVTARDASRHYGLAVEAGRVKFQKGAFKMENVLKQKVTSERLNLPLVELFSYKTKE